MDEVVEEAGRGAPLGLLSRLYADEPMTAVFSAERTVQGWLDFEAALAQAQAELGILEPAHAAAIAAAARLEAIDLEVLWRESRIVGYPVVSLVRQLAAAVEPPADGRVHYGATTQDVMDSGLAVQLGLALDRLEVLVAALGDALVEQMGRHRDTVMAARTHGQQAVPTTFGATLAPLVAERFARNVVDLSRTEIGEVGEPAGDHRGASSTMPQKVNPIASEAIIGMAATAGGLVSTLVRAMEAGHERAAGEWQAEWEAVPQLAGLAAGSLALAGEIARGLRVDPAAMERNLEADGGLVMAEASMMRLADEARAVIGGAPLRPRDYVGDPHRACDSAAAPWRG